MSCQGFVAVAQFWIWLPDNFGVNFFGVIGKFHNSLAENSRSWWRPYYILSAFLPLLKFIRREKQNFPRMNGLVRADCQKFSPCRVVKREPCDDFRQNHRCGLRVVCIHVSCGVVCTRLPRGRLYTSTCFHPFRYNRCSQRKWSCNVTFLWQAQYLVTLEWFWVVFSWQAHYLVRWQCYFSWPAQYVLKFVWFWVAFS